MDNSEKKIIDDNWNATAVIKDGRAEVHNTSRNVTIGIGGATSMIKFYQKILAELENDK